MTREELFVRLDRARRHLAEVARAELPAGRSEPDPGASERWDARQVWAHMAEFVGYWHRQLETVVRNFDGMPVPFGRVKTDPDRIGAIEMGRHRPIGELAADLDHSIEWFQRYLRTLDEQAWQAQGVHPTAGVVAVPEIVDRFVVGHLEEHAQQLASLA